MCYKDWKEVKRCCHCKKESLILKHSDFCEGCTKQLVSITKSK